MVCIQGQTTLLCYSKGQLTNLIKQITSSPGTLRLFVRTTGSMNYLRFMNDISLSRKPSPLREITKLITLSPVPIINLGTGFPNATLYPFENISVTLKDGIQMSFSGNDLTSLLQYGPSEGYPPLLKLLRDYQLRLHNPPMKGEWSIVVTSGSQDAMCKSLEMLLSPGDYIISEEYIYPGAASILKPYNVKHLRVKGDKDGIRPDSLSEVLSQWKPSEISNTSKGVPKILYTVPNGSNPVGTTISTERRKEIYKIAQDYNLLILEDDPYYFMHFGQERPPSFLSLDVDGRVLRFDSFSKMFSGGIRVGFVTGPQELLQRIVYHIQVSVIHASTLAQVIIYTLLANWEFEGYLNHAHKVAKFYESRRDLMIKYANKWLKGLAQWNVPEAGMFLWVRVLGVNDTKNLVTGRCLSKKMACVPGTTCTLNESESPYIRLSFSIATEEDMDKGFQSLADAIKDEIENKENI